MIFGKEYDLSLWYMLKVHNLLRCKMVKFVKELPDELLNNIRTVYLNGIEKNVGSYDNQETFYNVPSDSDSGVYYKFYIMCRDLYIYKINVINGTHKNIFSMVLHANDANDIMQMENHQKASLGSIGIGHYPEIGFREVDYNLKITDFGYQLLHTYCLLGNVFELKFGRPVSIKNMPDEMYLEKGHQKKLINKKTR